MSQFTPVEGTITSISAMQTTVSDRFGCTLIFAILTRSRETINIVVTQDTYVMNQQQFQRGDQITAFYDNMAPVPLIFPPQYRAVAIIPTRMGQQVTLDYFNRNLTSSDGTLRLNHVAATDVRLQNGQRFLGTLGDQILLVTYTITTRSIPAQTTPSMIVVFCTPA